MSYGSDTPGGKVDFGDLVGSFGGNAGFDYDFDNELNDDTLANNTDYASDFSGKSLDFVEKAMAYAGYNWDSFLNSFSDSSTSSKIGKAFAALKSPAIAAGIVLGSIVGKTAKDLIADYNMSPVDAEKTAEAISQYDSLPDTEKAQVKADVSKSVNTAVAQNSGTQDDGRGFSSGNLMGNGSDTNPVMSGDPNNPNWNPSFDYNVKMGGWGMGPADVRKVLRNPTDRYNLKDTMDLTQFGYSADGSELINPTQAQTYPSLFKPYTDEMLSQLDSTEAIDSTENGGQQMTTSGDTDDPTRKIYNDFVDKFFQTSGGAADLYDQSAKHASDAANSYSDNLNTALDKRGNTLNFLEHGLNNGKAKQEGLLDSLISEIQNGRGMYAPTSFKIGGQPVSFLNKGARNTANTIAGLGQQGYDNLLNFTNTASGFANTQYNDKANALSSILGTANMTNPAAGKLAYLDALSKMATGEESRLQSDIKNALANKSLDTKTALGSRELDQREPGWLDQLIGIGEAYTSLSSPGGLLDGVNGLFN